MMMWVFGTRRTVWNYISPSSDWKLLFASPGRFLLFRVGFIERSGLIGVHEGRVFIPAQSNSVQIILPIDVHLWRQRVPIFAWTKPQTAPVGQGKCGSENGRESILTLVAKLDAEAVRQGLSVFMRGGMGGLDSSSVESRQGNLASRPPPVETKSTDIRVEGTSDRIGWPREVRV